MTDKLKAPKVPCGSCPYRRDVPSGIWSREEYEKLPRYDGGTMDQFFNGASGVFLCHQKDGHLCGGWLQCHGPSELVSLRLDKAVDPSVFAYETDVPVFSSGQEAMEHGIRDIEDPSPEAKKMVAGLVKKRGDLDDA